MYCVLVDSNNNIISILKTIKQLILYWILPKQVQNQKKMAGKLNWTDNVLTFKWLGTVALTGPKHILICQGISYGPVSRKWSLVHWLPDTCYLFTLGPVTLSGRPNITFHFNGVMESQNPTWPAKLLVSKTDLNHLSLTNTHTPTTTLVDKHRCKYLVLCHTQISCLFLSVSDCVGV